MKNLKDLIAIESYKDKDSIINYLKEKLKNTVSEIKIITNKENNNKSLLIGINSTLQNAWRPHCSFRTH